jgi:hypothetical protein
MRLHEYQCQKCLIRFTIQDWELSGRILCAPCAEEELREQQARYMRYQPVKCPVCYRPVVKTPGGKIGGHFDRAGSGCPASWESFTITLRTAG